jgi:hypothetical protein
MHAPDFLPGLLRVARHAAAQLEFAITNLSPEDCNRERIRAFSIEMNWVKQNVREISRKVSDVPRQRERMLRRWNGNPVLHKVAMNHGLWCLMWHDHPDSSLRPVFQLFVAKALAAHMAVLRHWSGLQEWKAGQKPYTTVMGSLYHETLAIRRFVMADHRPSFEPILRQLAECRVTLQNLDATLRRIATENAPRDGQDASLIFRSLCSILWLFRREQHPEQVREVSAKNQDEILEPVLDVKEAPKFEPGEYQLIPSPMTSAPEEEQDVDVGGEPIESERDPAEVEKYLRIQWTPEQLEDCHNLGLHPAEVLPSSYLRLSNRKSGPLGRQNWREKENQLLNWSLHDMPLELAAEALETAREAADNEHPATLELFALVMAVFRTGITLAAATKMVVCSKRPKDEDVQSLTLLLGTDPEVSAEWIFPALPIRFRGKPVRFEGCREVVSAFVLPDLTRVGHLIRRLLDFECGGVWDGRVKQPFQRTEKYYKGALRKCLAGDGSKDRELLASYCTFERLSMVRFHRIYELAAENVVPATYATLRPHDTGEVPRFYETLTVCSVQELDRMSTFGVFHALQELGFAWAIDEALQPSDTNGDLGSPYCPTAIAVQEYLSSLRWNIAEANTRWNETKDPAFLIQRHSYFVTYTQVGYLIGTCHRAVQGAYAEVDDIDAGLRLLTIRDKGTRGRQVAVGDVVWTQMLSQRAYVNELRDAGFLTDFPELPIFLLGPDRKVIEIRPATLQLPWPMNFGRHLVRSEFAEAILNGRCDITIQYLKEMMDHAAEGEERDGPCSTFNYRHYSSAMRGAMDGLLANIEYWPINIKGQKLPILDSSYVPNS